MDPVCVSKQWHVCVCVCLRTGAFTRHPPAPRPSKGDHAASGGGAGNPPKPDTVTAAAGPCRRQADAQSAGQKHTWALASARQQPHSRKWRKYLFTSTGAGSPSTHPPPHSHCSSPRTYPALPSSCYRGDRQPFCLHQHHVHIQTEPGHHCAGKRPKCFQAHWMGQKICISRM